MQCIEALRTFVEASFMGRNDTENPKHSGGKKVQSSPNRSQTKHRTSRNQSLTMKRIRSVPQNIGERPSSRDRAGSGAGSDYDAGDEDDPENNDMDDLSSEYHHVSLQLLDLMHTLHTRAAQIHYSWAEETQSCAEIEEEQREHGEKEKGAEAELPKTGDEVTRFNAGSHHSSTISVNTTSRLWVTAWCPLLQGMARLCCDRRSHIR